MLEKNSELTAAVLGSGSWGTAFSVLLGGYGFPVRLWGVEPEELDSLRSQRENVKRLSGIKLPDTVAVTDSLEYALQGAELVVIAVPSHAVREVVRLARPYLELVDSVRFVLSLAKGLELDTQMLMSEIQTMWSLIISFYQMI